MIRKRERALNAEGRDRVRLGLLVVGTGFACWLAGCGGAASLAGPATGTLTPLIVWATPAQVAYGAALTTMQLDATANVPGTFAYSPSLGTVLQAGSQPLRVTFTPTDTTDYTTATASTTIQVSQVTPQLSWAAPAAILYGTALSVAQLDASSGSIAGTFAYSPAAGTVPAAGSQPLRVTFTPTDTTDYATATASTTIQVSQVTPTLSWTAPAAIVYGTALSGAQLDASSGNIAGTFAYSPTAGTVLTAGSQTLTVTFTPTDSADYASASASVSVKVSQDIPAITWAAPSAIAFGTALGAAQLDASSGGVAGTFSYLPVAGTMLAAGSQPLGVTFTPTDTTDYTTATASTTIQVSQSVPTLSWPAPAAIVYGTALSGAQLDATASVPGTFSYSPALGSVLTAGAQTLAVTFTPADQADFADATASVTLSVGRADPVLAWTPEEMTVGSPLGNAQLNAAAIAPGGATLPGSFLYSPDAGTVFSSPGPETVTVTFTPQDSADFQTAESSVSINVATFGVVAWGDSMTQGNEGTIDQGVYPTELAALITLPVVNEGIGGQGTTQTGVREGGVTANVTVAGGIIPASGGVTITFHPGFTPTSSVGVAAGIQGTIAGVHGLVTVDSSDVNIFTRTAPGAAVSAPGTPALVVDRPYASWIPIFWEGRNSLFSTTVILQNIAGQVATVPMGQTYLILSIANKNVQSEWPGSATYQEIVDVNKQLASAYGAHYMDIREILVQSYDSALITDVSDFSHDEVPTSLRAIQGITTLADSIGPTDTAVTLTSPVVTKPNYVLTIDTGADAENVFVTAVSGSTYTVVRNLGGLNTSHAAGAPVTATDSFHLNAQGYQIVAQQVAEYLSQYDRNPLP